VDVIPAPNSIAWDFGPRFGNWSIELGIGSSHQDTQVVGVRSPVAGEGLQVVAFFNLAAVESLMQAHVAMPWFPRPEDRQANART
jgi:hypothetical protein